MERDLILILQAVQIGLADPDTVAAASRAFRRGDAPSLRAALIQRAELGDTDVAYLELAVERVLKRHEGDARRALAELGFHQAVEAMGLELTLTAALPNEPMRDADGLHLESSLVLSPSGPGAPLPAPGGDGVAMDPLEGPPRPPGEAEPSPRDEGVTPEAEGRYQPSDGDVPREMGRGGVGRVRLVYDRHQGREVALRELLPAEAASETGGRPPLVTRFLREARVLGQLEHPGVVPVYEVGQRPDGTLYYTLRRVQGQTLANALRECKTLYDRLALVHQVVDLCQTVAYAHSRGVCHRDLTPENVLLGGFGETVVLDWSLARVRGQRDLRGDELTREIKALQDAEAGLAMEGTLLGTPAYMSPEQASGDIEGLDERADVWSLGAMLYEVLTGHPPFRGETAWEVLGKVRGEAVVPPRELNDAVPAELSAVCSRALERSREARYGSAAELAADLRAFQTGGRVAAYEYSSWELLGRLVARHKALTVAAVLFLGLLLGGAAMVYRQFETAESGRRREHTARLRAERAHRASQQARDRDDEARRKAERSERRAHGHLAEAYLVNAWRMLRRRRHASARVFAAAALLNDPNHPRGPYRDPEAGPPNTASELRLLTGAHSVLQRIEEAALIAHDRTLKQPFRVWRVAFSGDGGYLAWCGEDAEVRLYSLSDQKEVGRFKMPAVPVIAVTFSPDSKQLAAAGGGGAVRLWSVPDGKPLATLKSHMKLGLTLAYSPDGKFLASGGTDRQIRVWDLQGYRVVRTFTHPNLAVWSLAYSPDGRLLASAGFKEGEQSRVRVWDVEQRRAIATFSDHQGPVWAVAFSPDGQHLVSGGLDRYLRVYDVRKATLVRRLEAHDADITGLAFSPDGKRIATASVDHTLRIWDTAHWKVRTVVRAHEGHIWGVGFSPDGRRLATGSWDRRVKLWRVRVGGGATLLPSTAPVVWAAYVQGSKDVVALGADQHLSVWDRAKGTLRYRLRLPNLGLEAVALSPRGRRFAYGLENRSIWVIDLAKGLRSLILSGPWGQPTALAFLPTGGALAVTGQDGWIRIIDLKSRRERLAFRGTPGTRKVLAISPDGRHLAGAVSHPKGQEVELWDLQTRKRVHTLLGHEDDITALTFTPDGRSLLSASRDQAVRLWDVATGKLRRTLFGHTDEVMGLMVSADGQFLVSTGRDNTVRLWRLDTGVLHQTFDLDQVAYLVSLSPDGKELAVPGREGVQLHTLGPPAWEQDPKGQLRKAEKAADLRLQGVELIPLP